MPFNPTPTTNAGFNPSNPNSGGNTEGGGFFGCNNNEDKDRVRAYWEDLNKNYGLVVKYWKHGYDLSEHDAIYGEHTTADFGTPRDVKVLLNIENMNPTLGQFGFFTDTDVMFYIPISEFDRVWGPDSIPNRGDLIQIIDEACDRPERQDAKVFQITSKRDSVEPVDLFSGHYVWFLEGKRYDFSYEKNAPQERGEQVTDSDFVGIMEGGEQDKSPEKSYEKDSDTEAREDLENRKSGTYGNYY